MRFRAWRASGQRMIDGGYYLTIAILYAGQQPGYVFPKISGLRWLRRCGGL